MSEEIVVPFRVPRHQVPMGTEFRSTWLTSSLDLLRERGLFDRYLANLPAPFHEPILRSIAGVWLPAAVAIAHYDACEALGLSALEQVQMGRGALDRMKKTIFSIGFRAAQGAGVTPWNVLRALPAIWEREWHGGGLALYKLGPKDARIEVVGFGGLRIPYCRNGLRGIVMGLCELVCTKAYAQEVRELASESTAGFRVAWA